MLRFLRAGGWSAADGRRTPAGWRLGLLLLPVALAAYACGGPAVRLPLKPFYVHAQASTSRIELDVPYREGELAEEKHRLDLFLPHAEGFPLLVFVHGGSLEKGDTAKRVAGHEIYRNIGRFYAARGVGVALVNYRLQPGVTWRDQVDDVAAATAWASRRLASLGGDGRLFLAGHSAGSWLVSHVALDRRVRARHGLGPGLITGVISVSGSGFDLTDAQTWEMFGREERWRRRFSATPNDALWKQQASVVPRIRQGAPPFLLLHSRREYKALARQNRLFCEALEAAKVPCEIEVIEGHGHRRMLLAVSHRGRPVSRHILAALEPSAGE